MEQVIKTLSEIEERAVRIMEHASSTKKELAAQSEVRIKAYDEENAAIMRKAIDAQKAELDRQLANELEEQKKQAEELIARMQETYDRNHTAIAAGLFQSMTV